MSKEELKQEQARLDTQVARQIEGARKAQAGAMEREPEYDTFTLRVTVTDKPAKKQPCA